MAELVGGLSVNAGPVDLYASYTKCVWGYDSHNGWAVSTGATWYFGLP